MKNMKKIAAIAAVIAMTALAFTGCSGNGASSGENRTLNIGLTQIAPHGSLDNCREGFIEGMKQEGFVDGDNVKFDYQNALGEDTNATTIAQNFVAKKYDMICAIATPSAVTAHAAIGESKIPLIFSAVSDPVTPHLVQSMEKSGYGATGTSDSLNLEGQMKMIRAFLPQAKTIGILYTTSEQNSLTHLAAFKELAPKYGFTIEAIGVKDASDVAAAADTLISGKKVDCINNFTDNNVVNNLDTILEKANAAKVPIFGSEEEQVIKGCVASESLDYFNLGVQTGKMAARVLKGEDINSIPVSVISGSKPVANKAALERMGLTAPAEYQDITYLESK